MSYLFNLYQSHRCSLVAVAQITFSPQLPYLQKNMITTFILLRVLLALYIGISETIGDRKQ